MDFDYSDGKITEEKALCIHRPFKDNVSTVRSLSLKEEHKLQVSENNVLRKIYLRRKKLVSNFSESLCFSLSV
jgi:hypothetical protein